MGGGATVISNTVQYVHMTIYLCTMSYMYIQALVLMNVLYLACQEEE